MKIAEYATTDKITSNLDAQFEIHLPLAEANINYKSKVIYEFIRPNSKLLNFRWI